MKKIKNKVKTSIQADEIAEAIQSTYWIKDEINIFLSRERPPNPGIILINNEKLIT